MKSVKMLTATQLAQRLDELQELGDTLDLIPDWLKSRATELNRELQSLINSNTFNKGVITPLPPDHIDTTNEFVITPKAPSQVDREIEAWEKSLE